MLTQWCLRPTNSRFARSNGAANVINGRFENPSSGHYQLRSIPPLHVVLIGCQTQGVRSCDFQFLSKPGIVMANPIASDAAPLIATPCND